MSWLAIIFIVEFAIYVKTIQEGTEILLPVASFEVQFNNIRYLVNKRCKTVLCRDALIETVGNLVPVVISYTIALSVLVLKMLSGSASDQIQLILMFGLPLIVGWVYHLVFLTPVSNRSPGRFLMQRLPQLLITTFMGLGGIIPIAMPLVNKSLNMSLLMPLSPLAVMTWWAIVVLGGLAGGFLIFLFERWEVKRGFRSWTILANSEGELIIPSCRKLWWWFLISAVMLLAGLIAGVLLSK
jgi:hypothetical protein